MEVKIYRESESINLIMDMAALEEYNELASELGLRIKDPNTIEKCPIVYPYLNSAMVRQLTALCPTHIEAGTYKRTTIPLDVLRVYKFAKDNEMFEGLEIWSDDKESAPMLIGWKYKNEEDRAKSYSWNRSYYLLARWGDCALELPELLQTGYNYLRQDLLDKTKSVLNKCKNILEDTDAATREIINGTFTNIYTSF
jgi:hypothetical protein